MLGQSISGWIQLGSQGGGDSNYYTNTSATDWGVNHDGAGHLSGYAWSKALGWINFNPTHSQVMIDMASGDFQGYAWSEQGGWIRFQQSEVPSYKVRYSLKEKPTLPILTTLTVSISGSGLIRSVPDGIYCSETGGDCQFQYDEGTVVTLISTAPADYQFSHWEGGSDCNDGQLVMTADISCLAHFQPVEPPPPCQTMSITTRYNGEGEIIDCKEVIITESGSVSQVIFTGQVENAGLISNSTIAAEATVTDGTLTGTIKNEGTIKNIKFVGVKLSGGKLEGTIRNSTQIGVIADVELLPPTILSGGLLSGQIRADSTSLIQDVQLKAGLRLTGGQLDRTIQGDPAEIAQIMADRILSTAQLSYVCLSPSVQLPLVLDNVIGEGVTFQIPQLNNQCLSKVDPSTFTVDQIEQFPPVAFLAMDAESLRKFSPTALAALTTEQFQHLPPPALNGLTTNQLRELPVAILNKISPQQLTAINRNEFQGLSDTELGRILVYLNADNISPAEVKPLLPKGWDIDSSGALTVPVGTQLTLRDLPPPAKLPSNVTLPPQPCSSQLIQQGSFAFKQLVSSPPSPWDWKANRLLNTISQ